MHKLLLLSLICCLQVTVTAQVTIGSNKAPRNFSVLEVNSTTGGIRYPQLNQATRDLMSLTNQRAYGLMIFNTSNESLEYYVESAGWTDLTAESNAGSATPLASVEAGILESTATTLTYNYRIIFSSINNKSNLRVGKYLDKFNIAHTVGGAVDQPLNTTTYPVQVVLNRERIAEHSHNISPIHCYAIYEENGVDRRVEFIVSP